MVPHIGHGQENLQPHRHILTALPTGKPSYKTLMRSYKHILKSQESGLGGLGVSMLASGTQVRGFKPGRRVFQGEKSSACLLSEGK
jgi:hypothetical protein